MVPYRQQPLGECRKCR